MNLDRKTFLRTAVLAPAALAAGARAATAAAPAPALPAYDAREPERFWQAVRDLYPLTKDRVYLNTGGLGPASRPALDAMAATTAKLQETGEHGHGQFAGFRATVAAFLGADPAGLAFVRNATEGNATVAAGLQLQAGDEVIFDDHAHPGGSFGWYQQARLRGLTVKLFTPDPGDPATNLARIAALVTPRTRAVQVSHITAPTGIVLPVADIARLCRERGIWFHIDGAQSAGMLPFSLREIGCDSFATSGHKWLGAPHETGVLYVRPDRLDAVAPLLVGAYSGDLDFLPGEFKLAPTALRYEYGTRNVAAAAGLAAAVQLQEKVGRERIAARGRELAGRVHAGLARIAGVEVLSPTHPAASSAMVTFRSAKVPQDTMFSRLLKEHAFRCRPVTEQKINAVRVSLHVFNSPAECDRLVAATAKITGAA
ncbi:MAG: hypothetical protein B9S34_05705 [Opitutia bacterium Tous-C1TDCM]|nr:MAG: hypothetical protein B9S34_05705 [Opitutae bacterium Tous-C1TDCM]